MLRATWNRKSILTETDFDTMLQQFQQDKEQILAGAFDTETTGLHIIYDKPFLYQFGWITSDLRGYAYSVDLERLPELARSVIKVWQVLSTELPLVVGHNIKFDLHMLQNIGLPYTAENVADTQVYVRLSSDALPVRNGGAPLGLKEFAKRYIDISAKDMEKALQEERTQISKYYNTQLKQKLKCTKKYLDEFFSDKLMTWQDLPEGQRELYKQWKEELPEYLQHITSTVTSDDIPYHILNRENVEYYGQYDIVWTLEIWLRTSEIIQVRENTAALEIEQKNIYPLLRMERVGFLIDYEYLKKAKEELREYILIRRQDLYRIAGEELKCSQSAKILQLLQELGLQVTTTEHDKLQRIHSELVHDGSNPTAAEFIEILQELRTLEKWYSTYLIRFLKNYRPEDGKIYTTINQAGTVSGRVTSDFQQFPRGGITTIDGRELFSPRRLVLAKDKEYDAIIYLDYSQIELRLQALYTILVGHPDKNLCRAYMPYLCVDAEGVAFDYNNPEHLKQAYIKEWFLEESGEKWTPLDVHGATTKIAFGIDETHPDYKKLRYKGKTTNFAKNYGAQFNRIKEMFPEYEDEQIRKIDEAYYKAFPGVKAYHTYCYCMANRQAYLSNLFGVKYYNASGHNLINMLVQGSGAYFLKQKIIEVDNYLRENNCKSKLLMQIHDELQFKKHQEDSMDIFKDIQKIMETWEDTKVPIVADMEITHTNWAEKKEIVL